MKVRRNPNLLYYIINLAFYLAIFKSSFAK